MGQCGCDDKQDIDSYRELAKLYNLKLPETNLAGYKVDEHHGPDYSQVAPIELKTLIQANWGHPRGPLNGWSEELQRKKCKTCKNGTL